MQTTLQQIPTVRRGGFALVIALVLMAFIFLLLVSLSSLVSVQTQESTIENAQVTARKNALLGLNVALGQLQTLAGPDQRVTAAASSAAQSTTVADANKHWIGVWDAAAWDPAAPESKRFLGWLVSSNNYDQLEAVANGADGSSATAITLLKGTDDIVVETVATNEDGSERYAYWIADESLKASVALSDPHLGKRNNDKTADQLRRTIAFRNDLNKLDELSSYKFDDAAWLKDSDNLIDWNSLSILGNEDGKNWQALINERRHDFTLNARGLLTDTRKGGWKHDLSLAFRDNTIFDNKLARSRVFNKEDYAKTYHSNTAKSKSFFGPRWEILRDYHQMWQQSEIKADDRYTINTSGADKHVIRLDNDKIFAASGTNSNFVISRGSGNSLDTLDELGKSAVKNEIITHEGQPVELTNNPIAPVLSYLGLFFKAETELFIDPNPNADPNAEPEYALKLVVQPIVHLWNPYNVKIRMPTNLYVRTAYSPVFHILTHPSESGSGSGDYIPIAPSKGASPAQKAVAFNAIRGVDNQRITYKINTSAARDLDPGEIRVFSQSGRTNDAYTSTANAEAGTLTSVWDEDGGTEIYIREDAFNNRDQVYRIPKGKSLRFRIVMPNAYTSGRSSFDTFVHNTPHAHLDAGNNTGYHAVIEQISIDNSDSYPLRWTVAPSAITAIPYDLDGVEIFLRPGGDTSGPYIFADFNPAAMLKGYHAGDLGTSPNIVSRTTTNDATSSASINASGSVMTGFWGDSIINGSQQVYLYDIPRAPLHSIAQMQNATVSLMDDAPAYAIGNSLAPANVDVKAVVDFNHGRTRIDYSWLLNNELWDSYFFSTAPELNGTNPATNSNFTEAEIIAGTRLPNNRYRVSLLDPSAPAALYDYEKAAAQLEVDGAFNVNSTSVDAWETVLGALGGDGFIYSKGNSGKLENPFFRHGTPYGKDGDHYQAGWKDLTNTQIRRLAEKIVDEVKERGPFMNLADFVNRRLSSGDTGKKGALQAAIDNASINSDWNSSSIAKLAPGYLSQADILSAIGPFLSVRGDTFLIRTYGCVRNPITNAIESEAWLEATVRRVPHYVDNTDPYAASTSAFGRRFVIESFKWLTKDEL